MSYRIIIGQTLNNTELLTDPTFSTGDTVNWDILHGGSGSGTLQYNGASTLYLETTDNIGGGAWADIVTCNAILNKNVKYHVELVVQDADIDYGEDNPDTGNQYAFLECFLGNISIFNSQIYIETNAAETTYQFDMWCQVDSKFAIRLTAFADGTTANTNHITINSASVKAYEWNVAYEFIPEDTDMNIRISSSTLFNNYKTAFEDSITLFGDAYDYVLSAGAGKSIDTKIESNESGAWAIIKQGYILTNDCEFESESVTVSVEDITANFMSDGFETEILMKMHFNLASDYRYLIRHRSDPSMFSLLTHSCDTGGYYYSCNIYDLWKLVRDYVNELSQGLIVFESDYFIDTGTNWYENIAVGYGWGIGIPYPAFKDVIIKSSFKQLYDNIHSIFNIGSFAYYDDGWKFKIEPKSLLFSEPTISKNNIYNIKWKYDTDIWAGSIKLGYKQDDYPEHEGTETFTGIDYADSISGSHQEIICEWVRNSAAIWDLFNSATQLRLGYYYVIEYDGVKKSTKFGLYEGMTFSYNNNITATENFERHYATLGQTYRDQLNIYTYIGTFTYNKTYYIEIYISETDMNTILANPYTRLNLTDSYHTTIGIIQEMTWNLKTHIATIKLLGT